MLVFPTEIFAKGYAYTFADVSVVFGVVMVFVFGGAAEGVLHGVAVGEVEHVVDSESGSAFPAKLHAKVALVVVEGAYFLTEEIGDVS